MEVKQMKIIGLTGGSGTGKGTVAARMRSLGAGWVDADAVYRGLCAENREMLDALDARFAHHRARPSPGGGRPRAHRRAAAGQLLPRKMRLYHRKQRRSRYTVPGYRCFISNSHEVIRIFAKENEL